MLARLKAQGPADLRLDQPVHRAALGAVRGGQGEGLPGHAGRTAASGSGTSGRPAWRWSTSPTPPRRSGSRRSWSALLDQGVDAFKTDFGERIPTDVVWFDGSDPQRMHNYYTHLYNRTVFELLERRAGSRRGGAVRPLGHRRRAAVPGALGRRLRLHLRVDGRDAARRAVAGGQRLRLLVARHRRLRGHPGRRRVQALVGVRAAVQPQPAARLGLVPGAVGVRRRGRRRHAEVHPAEDVADAVPVRRGRGRCTKTAPRCCARWCWSSREDPATEHVDTQYMLGDSPAGRAGLLRRRRVAVLRAGRAPGRTCSDGSTVTGPGWVRADPRVRLAAAAGASRRGDPDRRAGTTGPTTTTPTASPWPCSASTR